MIRLGSLIIIHHVDPASMDGIGWLVGWIDSVLSPVEWMPTH